MDSDANPMASKEQQERQQIFLQIPPVEVITGNQTQSLPLANNLNAEEDCSLHSHETVSTEYTFVLSFKFLCKTHQDDLSD